MIVRYPNDARAALGYFSARLISGENAPIAVRARAGSMRPLSGSMPMKSGRDVSMITLRIVLLILGIAALADGLHILGMALLGIAAFFSLVDRG